MIIDSKEITLAYRCPKCGKMIFSVVGIFSLSGDLIKLKCECHQSELTLTYTNDRKIRLSIPCFICPTPHNYVLAQSVFFAGNLFRLSCPYSGIDIAFIGTKDEVIKASEKADEEFIRLLSEAGVEDFATFADAKEMDDEQNDLNIPDSELQSIIHFMLCELEDEGNISCRCGKAKGHYQFKFVGEKLDNVLIYCEECSASISVPITDVAQAHAFLNTENLKLT